VHASLGTQHRVAGVPPAASRRPAIRKQNPGQANTPLLLRAAFGYPSAMDTKTIANEICDQADDFLAGVTKRDEARAGIAEYLTMHHAALPPAEKKAVVDQTMRILEHEGFFEADAGAADDAADFTDAPEQD
jgi:hypothetical protein